MKRARILLADDHALTLIGLSAVLQTHHDVVGSDDRFEPRPELHGQIERRKSSLANDHRMDEFDGHMLRVGGISAVAESEQAAAAEKAFRHAAAGGGQARGFAGEEIFAQLIAHQEFVLDALRQ